MPAIHFIRYYQSVPGSQISRPGSKDLYVKIMKKNTAKATDIKKNLPQKSFLTFF